MALLMSFSILSLLIKHKKTAAIFSAEKNALLLFKLYKQLLFRNQIGMLVL